MNLRNLLIILIAKNRFLRKIYESKYFFLNNFFNSYSQHREDIIIDKLLKTKKNGFYVDIGANNPTNLSNTKRFYDKGWTGINIEPNTRGYNLFLEQRRRDTNLNIGISKKEGNLTFYHMKPDLLSTFSKNEMKSYLKNGYKLVEEKKVKTLPLKKVLDKYVKDKAVDFFSIDTEGFDLQVLKSNDWKKYKPKVICIETVPHTKGKQNNTSKTYLEKLGYTIAHQNNTNTIFILN